MEVTWRSGLQSVTRQFGLWMRFNTPRAISESSSLKPWKVSIAMCIAVPLSVL